MTIFMLRNFAFLFLFLSAMCASLNAQQAGDPILPGGGGGNPPILWTITAPNGNISVGGTNNPIPANGTWPLNNEPPYIDRFIIVQMGPFTSAANNQQIGVTQVFIVPDGLPGNWSASISLPDPNKVTERNWPAGTTGTISIGKVKWVAGAVKIDPVTGVAEAQLIPEFKTMATKTFTIINP